jgi:hypothetical protein
VAGDFAHSNYVAIGGRDKNFVGGVEIFETEGVLFHNGASFADNFKKNVARYAFEASGAQRRSQNGVALDDVKIRGGTFGDFAAFIEHDDFIASVFLRFRDGPDVVEPRNCFYADEGGGGVPAMFADGEANWLLIFGKRRGVDDEIDGGLRFVATPEADLVIYEINARATVGDFVGANDFLQLHANAGSGVRHGQVNNGGVFFQAAPVAFKGESFAAHDAQRCEKPPTVDEAGLSGRQADLFDGKQLIVVKDVAMNQGGCLAESGMNSIVTELANSGPIAIAEGSGW